MQIKQVLVTLFSLVALQSLAHAQTAAPPVIDTPTFKFYGILMPQLIVATHAMSSFSQTNMSAITEAAPSGTSAYDRPRASFQTQQTRIGFDFVASADTRAKVEVDFIDFAKSSPSVQANPRLRVMKIEHDLTTNTKLFMGQDWDLFSPQKAYTYNLVGNHFRSGNAAFIRQQLGLISQFDGFEFAGSIGFPIPNALSADQTPETEQQPAYQARIAKKFGNSLASVSGIYAAHAYEQFGTAPATQITALDATSSGANIAFETTIDRFEIRAESFFGHNLANLGTLTIGQGTRALNDADEVGGFVSLRYKFERSSLFGGYGIDQILNSDSVTDANHGVRGMKSNQQARVGFDWEFTPKFKAYVEGAYYSTKYFAGTENAYAQINGLQLSF